MYLVPTAEIGKRFSHDKKAVAKADTPATNCRYLEARTQDGRFASAASHSNSATVLRVRARNHPKRTGKVLEVKHGPRTATGTSIGKLNTPRAVMRAGAKAKDTAQRFGSGFRMSRVEHSAQEYRRGAEQRALNGWAGVAGATASSLTPAAGLVGASDYAAGRHHGRKQAMAKGIGGTSGKSSDGVNLARWNKPNSMHTDGARHGRRLV